MHEVDTAVWRCSAQKKPPLHAHRPATTCEVTCEGAIENPTASERSAKSRSLTRTKFEIATVESVQNSKIVGDGGKMCRVTSKLKKTLRCCSGGPNKTRECVESHQNSMSEIV